MKKKLSLIISLLSTLSITACAHDDDIVPHNEPNANIVEQLPQMPDTSFFYEQRLFAPGDYGSSNWRIPAILCLDDGTLLIANDKRKYNESDLPQDIDVVSRRSTDNGRTWSEPVTIAQGSGVGHGYGDPGLVQCANGDIICTFAGGNGFWQSTVDSPIDRKSVV